MSDITTIEAIVVSDSASLLSPESYAVARQEGWDIRMSGDRPDIFLLKKGMEPLPTAQHIHIEAQQGSEPHLEAIKLLRGWVVESLFREALQDAALVKGISPKRACMMSGWEKAWGFRPSELKYLGLKQVPRYGYWAAYHEVVNPSELIYHSGFCGWQLNRSMSPEKPQVHGHIYWLGQEGIIGKVEGWALDSLREINNPGGYLDDDRCISPGGSTYIGTGRRDELKRLTLSQG